MVEPLLYAALGFLIASLVALFLGRALWSRAVRLTTHRIMRRLPLSRDEIVASRDLMRAEQAIEHRRLERLSNVMRQRMTQAMADIGRRDTANFALRTALGEANTKIAEGQTREGGDQKTIENLKAEIAGSKASLAQIEARFAEAQRTNKQLERERSELIHLADARRLEVSSATAQAQELRLKIGSLEQQISMLQRELAEAQRRSAENLRGESDRADGSRQKLVAAELDLAQYRTRAESALQTADALRSEKAALERELDRVRTEHALNSRQNVRDSGEDITLLRQQIERLAGDLARAANGNGRASGGGGGVLQSAVRASRDAEQISAASVTFPTAR